MVKVTADKSEVNVGKVLSVISIEAEAWHVFSAASLVLQVIFLEPITQFEAERTSASLNDLGVIIAGVQDERPSR